MSFATLSASLRLNIADFSSNLSKASAQMSDFASKLGKDYGRANTALTKHTLGLKDTARIVQGILVSQAFYTIANQIQQATSALWQFNKELDYAHVTYSALFGDTQLANDFMSVLQEHAIETIFNYQDLTGISKKLLAYGIDYKNLMFIMEGLTNLGTMSGDPAALDRIALALGQIYTKGKLSAEEMRQLANAYVPITDIIREKFGLSEDDLKRVGDLNLPAEEVINAIVDYANDNFGSVGDAAMYTITGLEAKIVETLKTVGAEMMAPLTTAYKSFLVFVARGLENIRAAYADGGIGGVFEYLVPNENTQSIIRTFFANIKNLFNAVLSLGAAAGKVLGNFAQVVVTVFNLVAPAITAVTNALAIMINALASTRTGAVVLRVALVAAAGAFLLMRAQALGALVVTVVTKAITTLSKALLVLATIITKHPILSLLALLGIALAGVAVSSSSANNALSRFFNTLSGTGGSSAGDTLQKTEEELSDANDALDNFNDRLEEGSDNAGDLEDSLGGVGNAAKKTGSLLSFDEVFKLNDPKDSSSTGVGSGVLEDIENIIGGLGSLGDALIPEIPDFSDYFSDFSDSLFGGLSESLREKIAAGGWGAIIGAIIGGLIGLAFGHPVLGAKVGAAVGAFAGVLFQELEWAISNVGVGTVSGIAAAIGNALSKFGAASFGTILKNAFASGGIKGAFTALASTLKSVGLKSILKGGAIGAVLGLIADSIAHWLWTFLAERIEGANVETAKVGQTIGSILGTIIGAVLGGPVGAMIGSVIGTFAGGLVGLFWEPISKWVVNTAAAIGKWVVDTATAFGSWVARTSSAIVNWATRTYKDIIEWLVGTAAKFVTWCADTINAIGNWAATVISVIWNWTVDTATSIGNWVATTATNIWNWTVNTARDIGNWVVTTAKSFGGWVATTATSIWNWTADTATAFGNWVATTATSIWNWTADTATAFGNWISTTASNIWSWTVNTARDIGNWVVNTIRVIVGFGTNLVSSIGTAFSNAWASISNWLSSSWTNISNWFTNLGISIATWWGSMFNTSTWTSGWQRVKSWFTGLWDSIRDWFTGLGRSIADWWDGLWDGKTANLSINTGIDGAANATLTGHARGGVFNREHVARFAEGNKAEAVIPLENAGAMQPFVDAVANGLLGTLGPIVAGNNSNASNLPPMYIGTLVADERGLRELYRKFELIQVQEGARRGVPVEVF